jgi:hypothetical protein
MAGYGAAICVSVILGVYAQQVLAVRNKVAHLNFTVLSSPPFLFLLLLTFITSTHIISCHIQEHRLESLAAENRILAAKEAALRSALKQ